VVRLPGFRTGQPETDANAGAYFFFISALTLNSSFFAPAGTTARGSYRTNLNKATQLL
jgi:hypothetical protein